MRVRDADHGIPHAEFLLCQLAHTCRNKGTKIASYQRETGLSGLQHQHRRIERIVDAGSAGRPISIPPHCVTHRWSDINSGYTRTETYLAGG